MGYVHEYRIFLVLVVLASLADMASTIHFMVYAGSDVEGHPTVRLVSEAYGPFLGPVLGKAIQVLVMISVTVFLAARRSSSSFRSSFFTLGRPGTTSGAMSCTTHACSTSWSTWRSEPVGSDAIRVHDRSCEGDLADRGRRGNPARRDRAWDSRHRPIKEDWIWRPRRWIPSERSSWRWPGRPLSGCLATDGQNGLVTFAEREERACAVTDELARWLMAEHVAQDPAGQADVEHPCPICQGPLPEESARPAQPEVRELMTRRGKIEYRRAAARCPRCRKIFFPPG